MLLSFPSAIRTPTTWAPYCLSAVAMGCFPEAPIPDVVPEPAPVIEPAPPFRGPLLCGVENAISVAGLACSYVDSWCEVISGCCNAEGFGGSAQQCAGGEADDCFETVRANLESGACFDVEAFDPSCDKLATDTARECSITVFASSDYSAENNLMGCQDEWTHGTVGAGEPCSSGVECAQEDAEHVSFCFPDFGGNQTQNVCHSYRLRELGESCGENDDSCAGGTRCNSQDICAVAQQGGQACQAHADCEQRLCEEGLCIGPGDPCSVDGQCGILTECDANNLCQPAPYGDELRCDWDAPVVATQ